MFRHPKTVKMKLIMTLIFLAISVVSGAQKLSEDFHIDDTSLVAVFIEKRSVTDDYTGSHGMVVFRINDDFCFGSNQTVLSFFEEFGRGSIILRGIDSLNGMKELSHSFFSELPTENIYTRYNLLIFKPEKLFVTNSVKEKIIHDSGNPNIDLITVENVYTNSKLDLICTFSFENLNRNKSDLDDFDTWDWIQSHTSNYRW